jgi:hypothetical protein
MTASAIAREPVPCTITLYFNFRELNFYACPVALNMHHHVICRPLLLARNGCNIQAIIDNPAVYNLGELKKRQYKLTNKFSARPSPSEGARTKAYRAFTIASSAYNSNALDNLDHQIISFSISAPSGL